jgi:hypothetical protein
MCQGKYDHLVGFVIGTIIGLAILCLMAILR